MTCQSRRIIQEIKIIGKIENVAARNGVNYTDGFLEFGGPLIHDTIVNGNFKLSFGSVGNNINYFSVSSNTTVYLEASNGAVGSFINIANDGVLLGSSSPTSKGLHGLQNFSPNYIALSYVQKIYVDSRIVGFPVSTDIYTPGPPQNGQVIAWNDPSRMWVMQAAGAAPTAGSDTQVIYNTGGTLVGHENFTFTTATNFLSVPSISLGHATLGGINRFLSALGSEANINIVLQPKALGAIELSVTSGAIVIGTPSSPNLVHRIQARGANPQVDLALETKGTDGRVFIGDKDEAGAYRYVAARGYAADLHLRVQAKGVNGMVILEPAADGDSSSGTVKIGVGSASIGSGSATKRILAESEFGITHLEIGGYSNLSTVAIGYGYHPSNDRFLTVATSSPDCNLRIYGKGQGRVAVNNIVRSKKVDLVNWNMNSGSAYSFAHGLPDHRKIISVEIVVRNDIDTEYGPLDRVTSTDINNGAILNWDATYIYTKLTVSSHFKSSLYDLTGGYVRGWAWINYEL